MQQKHTPAFFNTIRGRLVALILLALVPAFAVQVFGAWHDVRGDIDARRLESRGATTHATRDFIALLAEARAVFTDLVSVNEVGSPGNCTQVFTALRFAYERLAPDAVNLGLAGADGSIYCAVNPVQGLRKLTSNAAFRSAVQTSDMAAGEYAADPASGPPQILIANPVLSFDGQLKTVIFVTLSTDWLERWQGESAFPPSTAVTLLATNGVPLWRSVDGESVPVPQTETVGLAWLPDLLADGIAVEGPDLDGVERLHTVVPLEFQGHIVGYLHLGYPVAQLYADAYRELARQLGLLSLVLFGTLVLAWQSSERLLLKPQRNLVAVVQRVQGGDLSARVAAVHGLGELTELAHAFDHMADTLQQRESERQQMEQRFRAAFESSAIGMALVSLEGRFLAANGAVCKMLGYAEEELKGRHANQHVYPPDEQVGMDLLAEMQAGKRSYYSVERRHLRRGGEPFWVRLTLSLVRDAQDQPAYLVALVEDIDEQKRAQETLHEADARFRAMYENAAIGISFIAPDGRVLAANPVLAQLSGYSEAELIAMGGRTITYPADADVGRSEFAEVVAGKRNTYQVEKRYVHRDGRIHWMRQSISAVRDPSGNLRYLVVIAEDIDDRKRAHEDLRESEARFKALFDNTAVGVTVMTLDRHIVQINPTVMRMTGYTAEELFRINPTDMVLEEDRLIDREQFRELVAGQRDQYLIEKRYLRRDGRLFWGRVNFALVRDERSKPLYILGMVEDISEEKAAAVRLATQEADHRRHLEQRIAERTEELNAANERLREKATQDAVMAERTRLARDLHDAVTQTLFSTTLIADVLPDLWVMNPPEGSRRLEELRQLTRGALAEMRTLLVELRPNALTEIPLPTLLRQLTEAMVSRARIAIELSAVGECKLPADVQVGLYRIAQEALNNIVKHAGANQVVVTLRLCEPVRLTVSDNGKGFDPGTVTADHLGLRIMRERAEAIGAKLSIYSEPGEGTHVSVLWQA